MQKGKRRDQRRWILRTISGARLQWRAKVLQVERLSTIGLVLTALTSVLVLVVVELAMLRLRGFDAHLHLQRYPERVNAHSRYAPQLL